MPRSIISRLRGSAIRAIAAAADWRGGVSLARGPQHILAVALLWTFYGVILPSEARRGILICVTRRSRRDTTRVCKCRESSFSSIKKRARYQLYTHVIYVIDIIIRRTESRSVIKVKYITCIFTFFIYQTYLRVKILFFNLQFNNPDVYGKICVKNTNPSVPDLDPRSTQKF